MKIPPQDDKVFRGQFVVGAVDATPAPGARRLQIDQLAVDIFPGLTTTTVSDSTGRSIGLLLGTPIDLDDGVVLPDGGNYQVDAAATDDIDTFVERHIYRLAGSFVFILDTPSARRIYLDANGSLSLVFDPARHVAAATTGLLLSDEEYVDRFEADLYAAFDVDHDGWFTGGLTAHRGIRRLLCNHYLDCETSQVVRHWPLKAVSEAISTTSTIAQINQHVLSTTQALIKTAPVAVALTAGNETRAMLANYRYIRDQLTFVTLDAPGYRLDLERAKELARMFDLKHVILPHRSASPAGVESWQYRVGHNITGNNMAGHPTIAPLAGQYFIGGLGGEVGRGFLWLGTDNDSGIDALSIIDRLKLPRHPLIVEEVEKWLADAPDGPTLFTLDLAYIELRMSCWAFSQSYASPDVVKIYPLISRAVYTLMLSLPPADRRGNGMIKQCIEAAWPDVLRLPINKYGDYRDQLRPALRAVQNPKKAWKKMRQLLKAGQ